MFYRNWQLLYSMGITHFQSATVIYRPERSDLYRLYPSDMKISGRAQCNCLLVKYIHHAKTGKFHRDEYNPTPMGIDMEDWLKFTRGA